METVDELKHSKIKVDDLQAPENLNQQDLVQARRMAALEAARAVRARIAAEAGGPLPDSTTELCELRETRADELASLCRGRHANNNDL